MSATIYEQTPGGLYAQPGRAVTTFPSGLVRVDQTYVCATPSAATHRATLAVGSATPDGDNSPSLETLAIFPEAQGVDRGDGFTEFRVSAYGQTVSAGAGANRALSGIQILPITVLSTALVGSPYTSSVPVYIHVWSITGMVVLPFGQSINVSQVDYDFSLNDAFDFYQTEGELLSYTKSSDTDYYVTLESGVVGLVRLSSPTMGINSYTNFGSFAEVSLTITRGTIVTEYL